MRFALIDTNRVEAEPGLKGLCPGCNQPVIAKCGPERVRHWAHRYNQVCDRWWERETEWHRTWKSNYPLPWQEKFLADQQTGDKHIVDVRTTDGLIIEFQHSAIKSQERIARESFYKDMVWVVDGSRNKRDFPRFIKRIRHFQYIKKGIFRVDNPQECFPSAWLESSVPVIFDFKGTESGDAPILMKNLLYCLFPILVGGDATVVEMPHETFIRATISGQWMTRVRQFIDELRQEKEKWKNKEAILRLQFKVNGKFF